MREIKFRAWDNNKNEWYCMEIFRGGHTGPKHERAPIIFEMLFNKHIVIEQYTGLKDKNGKEIYEGDLVNNTDDPQWVREVRFRGYCFWFIQLHGDAKYPISMEGIIPREEPRWEITGNIHD